MKYQEALSLARQIHKERPDLLPKLSGYDQDWRVKVRKVNRRGGMIYSPMYLSKPYEIEEPEEWPGVSAQI